MAIYYYVPENSRPSWGVGMIYYHVWLLHKNNLDAYILYDSYPYKIDWLSVEVGIKYLNDKDLSIKANDTLIIPEVCADIKQLRQIECKKIVFIQNAFYIYEGLSSGLNYEELGVSNIFYYMPHLERIIQNITNLPTYETPAFIAPYYFLNNKNPVRRKQILLFPKFYSKEYDILKRILKDRLGIDQRNLLQKLLSKGWEIIELKDKKHQQVAHAMQQATFFVSLNTTEAFNSAVPEAMASGCINICYEAYGPKDFLQNNHNAYAFSNNHIYDLAEKLINLIQNFDVVQDELHRIRENGYITANKYKISHLEDKLIPFFA